MEGNSNFNQHHRTKKEHFLLNKDSNNTMIGQNELANFLDQELTMKRKNFQNLKLSHVLLFT